jgi:hypothetical protein
VTKSANSLRYRATYRGEPIPATADLVRHARRGLAKLERNHLPVLKQAIRLHRAGRFEDALPQYLLAAIRQHAIAQQWVAAAQCSLAAASEAALRTRRPRLAKRLSAPVNAEWQEIIAHPLYRLLGVTPQSLAKITRASTSRRKARFGRRAGRRTMR